MAETRVRICRQSPGKSRALRVRSTAAGLALLVMTCPGWVAPLAAGESDHEAARKLRESGEILPLERIVERARTAKAGEIIETELESEDGRYVYEVEVLDAAGQVWEVKLDAKTGALLEIEQDD